MRKDKLRSASFITPYLVALLLLGSSKTLAGPQSWNRATELYEGGNYQQALLTLQSMNSNSPSVHYLMGMCYKNLGKVEQAKRELKWVAQYSTDAQVQQVAQTALQQLNRPTPAIPTYTSAFANYTARMNGGKPVTIPTSATGVPLAGPNKAKPNLPAPPHNLIGDSASATVMEAAKLGWTPCPGQCLKLTTPGWHHMHVDGHADTDNWYTWEWTDANGHASKYCNQNHVGHIYESFPDKPPVDKGACPVCGGTGWVPK
jgi:tetratricopeptide (TPR) repeat protein